IEFTTKFYLGISILPFFWLTLHYLSGYYKDIYKKSRLKELGQTFTTILIGTIIIFFVLLLDDEILSYKHYYNLFFALFTIQFSLCYIPRLIITSINNKRIQNKKIQFNTLIIGNNRKAKEIFLNINNQEKSTGNKFIGFVSTKNNINNSLNEHLEYLGELSQLKKILTKHKIEEVIIALDNTERNETEKIINLLYNTDIVIKAIPNMYDILTGKVKMSHIFSIPLIQISHTIMPIWQQRTKEIIDIIISLAALIISSPIIIFIAAGIKLSSKGPIIYSHERIGKFGKPFTLYKFRSMYTDAEFKGPALSSKNDSRITNFGKFMRKTKLDEIPNFYNVLKGDMSLVGPRPERRHFINQIIKKSPHYLHLQKVKPGITSWGQVKYGYAENVDEMVKRLKYDILYIENMSLYVDFKIIIYTIITIFKGNHI
ncbi:MAG: exopolysaccharide biosynthesis polyprenyl glycosylphosphotransferase, partial [Bacteroidota bacterium]|nr:exopolysaccharide biosynthesis polyprenyl glycosylphosphotransferase [Bacteroidota bacterium]